MRFIHKLYSTYTNKFVKQGQLHQKGEDSSMSSVPPFWQNKYKREASKNWNLFYKRNEDRFFKDRHWIGREFPELFHPETKVLNFTNTFCLYIFKTIAEIGCGVGNFALPLLEEQNTLEKLYACDFSEKAIEILKSDERHSPERCVAFVSDITQENSLLTSIPPKTIDVITSIFVFSAIPPEKFTLAIANLKSVLRPGGLWLFRDYAVNDAAQLRFKDDRKLTEKLFVRQDGTLSYFFDKGTKPAHRLFLMVSIDELIELAIKHGFEVLECDYFLSKTTNVKKEIDVDRTFVQAKFRLKE